MVFGTAIWYVLYIVALFVCNARNILSCHALNCSATLFADDTCLLINDKNYNSLENHCNNELNRIQKWMACNKLMINPSKSQVLIFPYSQRQSQFDLNLIINEPYLSIYVSVKYLGMIFDSQLKFDQHIAYITKNC